MLPGTEWRVTNKCKLEEIIVTIATILSLGETALKLGLICSLTVLALFLSYSMLNVFELSTDG